MENKEVCMLPQINIRTTKAYDCLALFVILMQYTGYLDE